MESILVLKEPDGRRIKIAGKTQLGRAPDLKWRPTDRPCPAVHNDLELAICIDDQSGAISRNHCAILPVAGMHMLYDLNSHNGTCVNGEFIRSGIPCRLQPGDTLSLADYVLLITGTEDARLNNHAVFVGMPHGSLYAAVQNDLSYMTSALSQRGFANNIRTLRNATVADVLKPLDELARLATSSSHSLFYYSGHGGVDGLVLNDGPLGPGTLYDALRCVRGKKAVILDSCHAGMFINNPRLVPDGTLVVAACPADGLAYNTTDRTQPFGHLTKTLLRYLREHPHSFDLQDLREAFKDYKLVYNQQPIVNDGSFTIISQMW